MTNLGIKIKTKNIAFNLRKYFLGLVFFPWILVFLTAFTFTLIVNFLELSFVTNSVQGLNSTNYLRQDVQIFTYWFFTICLSIINYSISFLLKNKQSLLKSFLWLTSIFTWFLFALLILPFLQEAFLS